MCMGVSKPYPLTILYSRDSTRVRMVLVLAHLSLDSWETCYDSHPLLPRELNVSHIRGTLRNQKGKHQLGPHVSIYNPIFSTTFIFPDEVK